MLFECKRIVWIYLQLLNNPEAEGEIINVGNENNISIIKLANKIIQISKSNSKIKFIPYEKAYDVWFADVNHRIPNIKNSKSWLIMNQIIH